MAGALFGGSRGDHVALTTDEPLPDRLSVDKTSKFFDGRYKRVGVRFNGAQRNGDVQEYCVSEGWIKVRERNSQKKFVVNPDGSYKIVQLHGAVEPFWMRPGPATRKGPSVTVEHDSAGALARAEAKRMRKAEKNARLARD